jgi:restriction system protein
MARRKRTSPAEDLMDLVALLPWWAGVAIAIVTYLVLHSFATQPPPAFGKPGELGLPLAQVMVRAMATVGQYLIPLLCLAGAGASAWRRRQRTQLLANVTANAATNALEGIGWQEFEHLVGEAFRLQGYRVSEQGGASVDGGVDLVLSKDGEKVLVQCKQWRAFKVGVPVVRELYGVMAAAGASGGIVVTSGRFTDEAKDFAQGRNVRLIDGPQLQTLLQQVRRAPPVPEATRTLIPACPLCAKPMTRRVARKGANAGGTFWGCTGFPTCRGVKPVA